MLQWLDALLARMAPLSAKGRAAIQFDNAQISLTDPSITTPVWTIRWDQILEIVAWKDDFFTYDVINIGFRIAHQPEYFSCNEEQSGWNELTQAVQNRFTLTHPDWYTQISVPAFQTNWTVLQGQAWHFPCRHCGYGLRFNRSRCPECGRAIPDSHEENTIIIHAAPPYDHNQ